MNLFGIQLPTEKTRCSSWTKVFPRSTRPPPAYYYSVHECLQDIAVLINWNERLMLDRLWLGRVIRQTPSLVLLPDPRCTGTWTN